MSLGLLFPGQGSQRVGMGRELADAHSEAAETFREADEVLDVPLSRIMWEGPDAELVETRNSQPAILTHAVAVLRVVRNRLGPVAFAAGHSLGEYAAHVAAGTLSFADALRAVRIRGELMFSAGEARPGTMAAILRLDDEAVVRVCREVSRGDEVVVPANFNSDGQVVISGDVAAVERALEPMKEAGARRVVALSVSGAFHSPLMAPARDGLREHLEGLDFRDPDFPVVANVTAAPVTRGAEARELLVEQLTAPVRWAASVRTMVEAGVGRFLELGPGNVLCGLNRVNAPEASCESVGDPVDLDALASPTQPGG